MKRLLNVCKKLILRGKKIAQLQDKFDQITINQLPTPYQIESALVDQVLDLMFER